jgi:phage-related protein
MAEVLYFQDPDGYSPVLEWLRDLQARDRRGFTKCTAAIQMLTQFGHELRRPFAAFLRDGIYELRARSGNVNYRLLYFFHGRGTAVIVHALTKEAVVEEIDIQRALRRRQAFEASPERHTRR